MGNGVNKTVMLFVTANLTHQKAGVHNQSGNQQREEDDAEEEQDAFPPVEDDPADIQADRKQHQANAQHHKESNGPAAAADAHGRILPRSEETGDPTYRSVILSVCSPFAREWADEVEGSLAA